VPLAQALENAAQIAEALDAAHKHGIVHRDLKPGNVMLAKSNSGRSGVTVVKLLDFGIAKLSAPGAPDGTTIPSDTVAGLTVGTPGYMSPEQVGGLAVDGRSDLFAFGAVLHEVLSGARAFPGGTAADRLSATLAKEPPAFAKIGGDLPGTLERIVRRCLAKCPDDRYDSARDLLIDLEPLWAYPPFREWLEPKG
jgi:serine/threonine protein kinase